MKLLDILIDRYGYNKPILLSEIKVDDMTNVNIRKSLERLVAQNKIIRYQTGVYYIPYNKKNQTGTISPMDVIVKKYISYEDKVYGFFAGVWLEKKIGISRSKPTVIEIITNNEPSKKRTVTIGGERVILRRSYVEIDSENYRLLQFVYYIRNATMEQIKKHFDLLKQYIIDNSFTRNELIKYLLLLPTVTSKKLIDSKLIYEFESTQF